MQNKYTQQASVLDRKWKPFLLWNFVAVGKEKLIILITK